MDAATKIWAKLNEFVGRVDALEKKGERTQTDVEHLGKDLELLRKEAAHDRRVYAAVQNEMAQELAKQQARIAKLESEKHGAKVSAGKAKAKIARLEAARH